MYDYHVETDEFIAKDEELCGAYDQLQKVKLNKYTKLIK